MSRWVEFGRSVFSGNDVIFFSLSLGGTIMNKAFCKRLRTGALLLAATACVPVGVSFAQVAPQAAPQAVAPATQPSVDEVQQLIDQKQYPAAVKAAGKLLSLHGQAAAGIDRFQVTMLKGYAQAGMKSISTAVMTFKSAKKETKDDNEIALADWTADLFHIADSTIFMSKTAGPQQKHGPFDLLNTDQRKQAFGALLDDNLAALQPKLKSAVVAQNIPQIWPVIQQVMDLDRLDVIANGSDEKTTEMSSALLEHARNLLSNALKTDWARVSDIDTHANTTVSVPTLTNIGGQVVTQEMTHKVGLTGDNQSELKNIISVCGKIHDAAEAFISISKSDKEWSSVLSDADRVAGRASDVLSADYGTNTTDNSGVSIGDGNGINTLQQSNGIQAGGQSGQFPVNTPTPSAPRKTNPTNPNKPKSGTGTGTGS
jgi:hypothetical protein